MNRKEKRPITTVLFDMDNTLFDFVEAKLAACEAVIRSLGLATEPVDLLRYFLRPVHGFESHEHIRDFLKDNKRYDTRAFQACCRTYEQVKLDAIHPYPHIRDTLASLHANDLKLAIVTDAHNGNARSRLGKAGLEGFFDCVISADMSGFPKPSPASFMLALKQLNVRPDQVVFVGDSLRRDVEPGNLLGMVTVYAAYGDRNFHENYRCTPDYTVSDVSELAGIILGCAGIFPEKAGYG